MRHSAAAREARHLVDAHDGSAKGMVEDQLSRSICHGDLDEALRLDQVRREIEHVYQVEGH